MDLRTLLDRARIKTYDRWTWFDGARLVGHTILIPDDRLAQTVQRCFLPLLSEYWQGDGPLDVKACQPPLRSATKGAKMPQERRSVFKGGYVPEAVAADLFTGEGE